MSIKKAIFKSIAIILLIVVTVIAYSIIRPEVFLPHKKIVIGVPFAKNDPPSNLIPMGETIAHPNSPHGHPGIDFKWDHNSQIIASADGEVTSIRQTPEHFNNWDIEVESGSYVVRYKELQDYNTDLHIGSSVHKGDFIGHPGHFMNGYQLHWEFASASFLLDRWCPMSYFDPDSKQTIEEVWRNTPDDKFRKQFPHICSGGYYNKTE